MDKIVWIGLINKQLLNEAKQDMKNSADQVSKVLFTKAEGLGG